jgi:uncharacterized protein
LKKVFADTLYWLAITRPSDPWRQAAKAARTQLGKVRLVTTDGVLVEFLTALAGGGATLRAKAAAIVRAILSDKSLIVVPQTRELFLAGLALYENRADKGYSLTDCISMHVMKAEGITDILTNDHHFEQEGFTILIR